MWINYIPFWSKTINLPYLPHLTHKKANIGTRKNLFQTTCATWILASSHMWILTSRTCFRLHHPSDEQFDWTIASNPGAGKTRLYSNSQAKIESKGVLLLSLYNFQLFSCNSVADNTGNSRKVELKVKTLCGSITNQHSAFIPSCPEATVQNVCAHELHTCYRLVLKIPTGSDVLV